MKHLGSLAILAITCAFPCAAQEGQLALIARTANVRAGPDRDYPIVAVLPPGAQVGVQGCLPDYRWCDVIAGDTRGWVYGGTINYSYQNNYVPLLTYGAIIGIGVLGFAANDYWGRHYRNRSFYAERQRFIDRPPIGPRFNGPGPRPPGFNGPGPRPQGFNGPAPRPPGFGPGRARDSNPSGAVLPGTPAPRPPRSGPNPSGAVIPGAPAPRPPRSGPNPSGAVTPGVQPPGVRPPARQPGAGPAPQARPQQQQQQQRQPAPQGGGSGARDPRRGPNPNQEKF